MKKVAPRVKRFLLIFFAGLFAIICLDVYGPWHSDLRKFDAEAIARIETQLWRDYYDKKRLSLYTGMVKLLRTQSGFPFFRACLGAYYAGRAAFVFKVGKNRADYARAIPLLTNYYRLIVHTGKLSSDPRHIADRELEWWIIHRERGFPGETALVNTIADTAGALYGEPRQKLIGYAEPRARAMLERSQWDQTRGMTENDWHEVEKKLRRAYHELQTALQ